MHFAWNRSSVNDAWTSEAFADDNTTEFGDHWAVDWLEIGLAIPNSGFDGTNYIIQGIPTNLDSSGTGYHLGRPYLFGRIINAIISRRTIIQQFPGTTINTSFKTLGTPSMSASLGSENFGNMTFQSGLLSTGIAFVGGILYEFYKNFILPASTSPSGTTISGPIGPNVTFNNNPIYRIEADENISDEDLLAALSNKF